jgi:hypothetical protein
LWGLRRLYFGDALSMINVQKSLVVHRDRSKNVVGEEYRIQRGGHLDIIPVFIQSQIILEVGREIAPARLTFRLVIGGLVTEILCVDRLVV